MRPKAGWISRNGCTSGLFYLHNPKKSARPQWAEGERILNMKKITIKNYDGKQETIEVSEEFAKTYAEMEKEEKNNNRRETRRHVSLNNKVKGCDFEYIDIIEDRSIDVEEAFIKKEERSQLHEAIKNLLPQQQKLIYQVFYEERSIKSLAEEYGVSSPAISNRLKKIYARLKNKLA